MNMIKYVYLIKSVYLPFKEWVASINDADLNKSETDLALQFKNKVKVLCV